LGGFLFLFNQEKFMIILGCLELLLAMIETLIISLPDLARIRQTKNIIL